MTNEQYRVSIVDDLNDIHTTFNNELVSNNENHVLFLKVWSAFSKFGSSPLFLLGCPAFPLIYFQKNLVVIKNLAIIDLVICKHNLAFFSFCVLFTQGSVLMITSSSSVFFSTTFAKLMWHILYAHRL